VMVVIRFRLLRLVVERQLHDAAGNIQAGIALEADRLQRERILEAANEHIDARPAGYRRAPGDAAIIARKRTLPDIRGRGGHGPSDDAARQVPDINRVGALNR